MFVKIVEAIFIVILVFGLLAVLALPFAIHADLKDKAKFEEACQAKGGVAIELRYDRICVPEGAVIPVGVE